MEDKDLDSEGSVDGIAPSPKSPSRRKPATRAHGYRNGGLNDAAMNNQKRKRPNAQKHGVFSVCPFIPNVENHEEFDKLHLALIDEWNPSGQTEENIVFSIADRMWRKLHSQRFVRAKLGVSTIYVENSSLNEVRGLMVFAYYVNIDPETAFEKYAVNFLYPDRIAYLKQNFPRSNYQSSSEWAEAIITEIVSLIVFIGTHDLAATESETASHVFAEAWRMLFDQHELTVSFAHARQFLDDDLRLQERLDADIARLVKELVHTKAMKEMLRQTTAAREDQQPKRITARNGLQS